MDLSLTSTNQFTAKYDVTEAVTQLYCSVRDSYASKDYYYWVIHSQVS